MGRSVYRCAFLFLTLLLAVQLTGLSCLGDWQDAAFALHSPNHHYAVSAQSDLTGSIEDGCPCHFSFLSMPRAAYSVENPVVHRDADLGLACPCTVLSVPFHPPLGP
jgi:hypothetical protein